MKKEIGQITWINYPNFGSILQAFALQTVIKELGYRSKLIDDKRFVHYLPEWKRLLLSCLLFVKNPALEINKSKVRRKFSDFKNKYLAIDNSWRTESILNSRYETFVCGSDQIWSPLLPRDNGGFYFASFADSTKNLIAYAPSLGATDCDFRYENKIKPWINKFKALSSREPQGVQILSRIVNAQVTEVIDPTMLLAKNQWEAVLKDYSNKTISNRKSYLLAYFLTPNESYYGYAQELARKKGLEFLLIDKSNSLIENLKVIETAGPLDFLTLIANASFIVTDSFHGTVFSILNEKEFITVKRFKDNDNNSQNSRVIGLLNKLNLMDRIREEATLSNNQFSQIDWLNVNERVDELKKSSISYLKRALS